MKKITLLFFTMFCVSLGFSQTFTDSGGPFDMQNGNGTTAATCGTSDELNLPLAVTGVGTLGGANSIESVTINVTHTWNSDVKVSLQDPSGTLTQLLVQNIGGSGDNFVDCVLIDSGSPLPTTTTTPVTGSFAPLNPLSAFNSASTLADGNWTLVVCDDAAGDVGTVDSWSITFAPTPTGTLDYYNLQWPPNGTIVAGETFDVYAQAYEAGLTDVTAGQAPGIESWIGYNSTDTDPSGVDWTWVAANFNVETGNGNNDEYTLNLGSVINSAGTFYYASRWSLEGGPYTYGGILADGSNGGTWGTDNNISGVLTVNPPANDDCTNATMLTVASDLTCTSPVSGTTIGASQSLEGCTGTANDDLWYSFVASSTVHRIIVTNTSGATDTVTEVFDACGGTSLICQDTPNSPVTVGGLVPANTYYFRIYTVSAAENVRTSFDVCVVTPPPPPANDNCATAIGLTVNADLACGNVTAGTTTDATASSQPDDVSGTPNNDVWYFFQATATSHVVSLINRVTQPGGTSTSTDMGIGVYDGSAGCSSLVFSSTSDPETYTASGLIIGQTYYVRVYGWFSSVQNINFDLCIGTPPAPPANDACSGANVISALPYDFSQTDGAAATNNAGFIAACSATSAASMNDGLWFTFTPATDGTVDIVVSNVAAGFDPQLDLYSGSCGTFTCVGSADSGGGAAGETLNAQTVTAGTQYFINVGYWSGSTNNPEGAFDINVSGTITLGVESIENINGFSYFPNPVKSTLNLKAQSAIQNVSIYNMLGQEVLRTAPNTLNSEVNMASLQTGAYFVKVTINDATETIRIIKQ